MNTPATPSSSGPGDQSQRGAGHLARLLFGLTLLVKPRTYLVTGILLMLFKYATDATLVWLVTQKIWWPLHYINPLMTVRQQDFKSAPSWLMWVLILWALPFLWVGASMTLRRFADAGKSPWLALLFFIPGVNYIAMLVAALLPSDSEASWRGMKPEPVLDKMVTSILQSVLSAVVLAVAMMALSVFALGSYGAAMFVGTPFVMGAVSAWVFNRGHPRSMLNTVLVAGLSVLLAACCMLLFALEGVLCIAMAAPLAGAVAIMGALVGWAITTRAKTTPLHAGIMVIALPLAMGAEVFANDAPEIEVVSSVIIDATPEQVWPNVIGFGELPEPNRWFFKTGISYPMRAKMVGEGVGAVRHCEFSTGPFVEPITRWEEPTRLSFDVESQPTAMKEWSPYRHVHAPHLDGYIQSQRGEFRLSALDDGRTRLEGSTWYKLNIWPLSYWSVWSDGLIQSIHGRVLDHIKNLSERAAADQRSSSR